MKAPLLTIFVASLASSHAAYITHNFILDYGSPEHGSMSLTYDDAFLSNVSNTNGSIRDLVMQYSPSTAPFYIIQNGVLAPGVLLSGGIGYAPATFAISLNWFMGNGGYGLAGESFTGGQYKAVLRLDEGGLQAVPVVLIATGVPDAGSTAALMLGSLGGMGFLRWKQRTHVMRK